MNLWVINDGGYDQVDTDDQNYHRNHDRNLNTSSFNDKLWRCTVKLKKIMLRKIRDIQKEVCVYPAEIPVEKYKDFISWKYLWSKNVIQILSKYLSDS